MIEEGNYVLTPSNEVKCVEEHVGYFVRNLDIPVVFNDAGLLEWEDTEAPAMDHEIYQIAEDYGYVRIVVFDDEIMIDRERGHRLSSSQIDALKNWAEEDPDKILTVSHRAGDSTRLSSLMTASGKTFPEQVLEWLQSLDEKELASFTTASVSDAFFSYKVDDRIEGKIPKFKRDAPLYEKLYLAGLTVVKVASSDTINDYIERVWEEYVTLSAINVVSEYIRNVRLYAWDSKLAVFIYKSLKLSTMLDDLGYEVEDEEEGAELVDHLIENDPELIMDYMLENWKHSYPVASPNHPWLVLATMLKHQKPSKLQVSKPSWINHDGRAEFKGLIFSAVCRLLMPSSFGYAIPELPAIYYVTRFFGDTVVGGNLATGRDSAVAVLMQETAKLAEYLAKKLLPKIHMKLMSQGDFVNTCKKLGPEVKAYLAELGMVESEYESYKDYATDAIEWVNSFALEDTDFQEQVFGEGLTLYTSAADVAKQIRPDVMKLIEGLNLP